MLNGKFKPLTTWTPIVQSVHHRCKFPKPQLTNTRNLISRTTKRRNATSNAFSAKWAFSMKKMASTLITWWSNWARAKMKRKSSQRLWNVPTKIHRKPTLVHGHGVDLTASKRHTWIWFKRAWRKSKPTFVFIMINERTWTQSSMIRKMKKKTLSKLLIMKLWPLKKKHALLFCFVEYNE